jgi:hypothetical protein
MENKLTNNEVITLRLLYSNQILSKDIPPFFFGEDEKNNLTDLGLIEIVEDGKYELTEKAITAIETGGYIIKYPLANEDGVVMNYKDVLESCTPSSAKALGLSIINTQFYKKWGKYNNMILLRELEETRDYYRKFEHPIATIEAFRNDIDQAKSRYERAINSELLKIKDFELSKPLRIGITADGKRIELVEIINNKTAKFKIDDSELVTANYNTDTDFYLSSQHKHQIIRQFYIMKSKPSKKATVDTESKSK